MSLGGYVFHDFMKKSRGDLALVATTREKPSGLTVTRLRCCMASKRERADAVRRNLECRARKTASGMRRVELYLHEDVLAVLEADAEDAEMTRTAFMKSILDREARGGVFIEYAKRSWRVDCTEPGPP